MNKDSGRPQGGARPPRPVPGELARTGLITRLTDRFSHAVTTVVAGAGFGKSTVLAQAVRHNEAAPLGIDAWVSCAPGFEDVERLTTAMVGALGHTVSGLTTHADQVVQAMIDRSPLDVCLIIDDCHLIPPGSSSERLLDELIRRLPSNGHLALSGRWLPDVPLARLRAQDAVLALTDRDLAFDSAEVAAAAERLGRDASGLADLGGWPALIRLALAAGPGVDRQFLREEVLASLSDDRRRALLALTVLGPARAAEVAFVADTPVELDALSQVVPMITVDEDGLFRAHQLWEDTVVTVSARDELTSMRSRAFDILFAAGELPRAASIAIADENWVAVGRCALELVRTTLTSLPSDTAQAWLNCVPAAHRSPAIALLEVAWRHSDNTRDPLVDGLLNDAIAACHKSGDVDGESTAIGLAAVVAHGRGDFDRLVPLAFRARDLPEGHGDPVVEMISLALDAALADLQGDPEMVLQTLERIRWDEVPDELCLTAHRLWVQAMWMTGRAEETYGLADERLATVDEDHIRRTPALSRWFAGDPTGFDLEGSAVEVEPSFNERDQFVGSCFTTVIMASAGSIEEIERVWASGVVERFAFDNARDSAHLTYMRAARAVLAHDEEAAAGHYAMHLDAHPLTDTLGVAHLRRWPALGVVLSPELRALWTTQSLGPSHQRAVECGLALLAARRGHVRGTELAPPQIYTQMPLPWSVELACRWAASGSSTAMAAASALIVFLADRSGRHCIDELRRVETTCPELAAASTRLQGQLPTVPQVGLEIRVLGPLEIVRGGVVVDAPELRRSRVRQLLMLLVVERSIRRERAIDLLWPDMAPDSAAGNLRVTLAHLRRLLEPDRGPGDAGYHLRADGASISLHRSAHLCVDLWTFEDLAAELARTATGSLQQGSLLTEMAALWRGDPLRDLLDVGSTALLIDRLRLRHLGTLLRLGELHIAEGDAHGALACAERAIDVDPYREHAHRLAVAAHLQMDDNAGARRSLDRLDAAMAEIGAAADGSTEILRRQVTSRGG